MKDEEYKDAEENQPGAPDSTKVEEESQNPIEDDWGTETLEISSSEVAELEDEIVEIAETSQHSPFSDLPENYQNKMPFLYVKGSNTGAQDHIDFLNAAKKKLFEKYSKAEATQKFNELQDTIATVVETDFQDPMYQDINSYGIWGNRPMLDGKSVVPRLLSVKLKGDSDRLTGPEAIQYLFSTSGTGMPTRVLLYNSGIVLQLRPFRERELLEHTILLRRMHTSLGYATAGTLYSADDGLMNDATVDFILDHTIKSNLRGWTKEKLRELIVPQDIMLMMAGGLATIYPGGYPIHHVCTNEECNHTIEIDRDPTTGKILPDSMMHFDKLAITDAKLLTIELRRHMSVKGDGEHDEDHILNYQARVRDSIPEELRRCKINIGDLNLEFLFKTPNLTVYEHVTNKFISMIESALEKSMAVGSEDMMPDELLKARYEYQLEHTRNLFLMREMHWIHDVKITDASGTVRHIGSGSNGEESLMAIFDILSRDEDAEEFLLTAIKIYKERTTVGITGLTNYKCPSCKSPQLELDGSEGEVIPIHMPSYFFTILELRSTMRRPGR